MIVCVMVSAVLYVCLCQWFGLCCMIVCVMVSAVLYMTVPGVTSPGLCCTSKIVP